jgi:hypothetical protein
VRRHLTRRYGERWMGRGWPVSWPPKSPDLNPVAFCLRGHVKSLLYTSAVDTVKELQQIEGACQQISNEPGRSVWKNSKVNAEKSTMLRTDARTVFWTPLTPCNT